MKYLNILIVILIIINILLCVFILNGSEKSERTLDRIDTLEKQILTIESKKDSVKRRIDTTVIKIEQNEKHYKEVVRIINNNTPDSNYVFFLNYLRQNKTRLDSIRNSNTIVGD